MPTDSDAALEILEQIDSGLYGRVFRARQNDLDRLVAVKIIKPEYSDRANAVDHAKALARVGVHPNIVTVYTVQQVKVDVDDVEMPAMVMEWLEGEKFGIRLGGPRFSEQEVRRICIGVLDGMERMHEAGMQHGDLHFGNIILLADCHPKIIDIDASQNRSLGRLSDISREGAIGADVDYCRQLVQRAFAHSVLSPSLVNQLDAELQGVMSLTEIRTVVERALDGPRSPSHMVPMPPAAPETAERLWAKVQEYIEEDRPASLHGLIMGQTRILRDEFLGDRFPVTAQSITPELVRERLAQYEECVGSLLPALAIGCYWGDQSHWNLWKQCIETAANCYEDLGYEARSGSREFLDLRQYPPLLLFYACGLGAFLNGRFETLRFLVRNLDYMYMKERRDLIKELIYWKAEQIPLWNDYVLNDNQKDYTPVSDHVSRTAYPVVSILMPVRSTFEIQFDRFEYFLGLMSCAEQQNANPENMSAPTGTFLWRRANERDFGEKFVTEAREWGEDWPPFRAGLFSKSTTVLESVVRLFDAYINSMRSRLHIRMLRR